MEGLLLDEESVYRAMDTAGSGEFSPLAYKNGKVYYASAKKSLAGGGQAGPASGTTWTACCGGWPKIFTPGRIAAEPLCPGGSRTPCDWCDYRAVCRHADGVAERSAPLPEDPFVRAAGGGGRHRQNARRRAGPCARRRWDPWLTPHKSRSDLPPAQAAAISARGGSLLVSAAAGSGKTRVLWSGWWG